MKKKNLVNLIKIHLFILAICFFNSLLSFFCVDDSNSYTRIMMHELYSQDENIDVLFLGSSHCYRSLNTEITDSVFNLNTFNLGSSSQYLDGSFTLLKEASKKNNIKMVYVELSNVMMGSVYKQRTEMISTYIIFDYMKPSFNKYSYILKSTNPDTYIDTFFPIRRNSNNILNLNYLSNIIIKKQQKSYMNFSYIVNETEEYLGKGFVCSYEQLNLEDLSRNSEYTSIPSNIFSEDDVLYINKIIDFCKKNNIELVFFSAPISNKMLNDIGNYDYYVQQVDELLSNKDTLYYDFNYCNKNILSLDFSDFKDFSHLNGKGADKFSKIFSSFFKGYIDENALFTKNIQLN